jgi:4-amino-4-deoxy-L-arabinose transferase-like glycosyltransferase
MNPDARPTAHERAILAGILCVAAFVRLYDLSLMELRHDSAFWAMEGQRIVNGGYWPLIGQQVGSVRVALANGPLLSYLTAAAFAVAGPDPRVAAGLIAVANVAGVWLTYRLGRHLYSPAVGLIAAALTASAPWLVLYGRMLWPQSLFPFLVPLLLLTFSQGLASRHHKWFVLTGVLLGIGLQLHLSILPFIAVTLIIAWARVGWRAASSAGAGVLIGYGPVLLHDAVNGFPTVTTLLRLPALHAAADPRAWHVGKTVWNFSNVLSGQGLWVSKLAHRPYLPSWIDWTQGILFSTSLLAAAFAVVRWRARGPASPRADHLVITFIAAPTVYLLLAGSQIHRHYFLVLYPLPFLLIARGITMWRARDARLAVWVSAAVLIGLVLNLATLVFAHRFLRQFGGEGEYGTALADKQAAVTYILHESSGYDVTLAVQERLPYAFLFGRAAADTEATDRLTSPDATAKVRTKFRIVEPSYDPLHAREGECVSLHQRGVVVLQPCTDAVR